MEYDSYSGILGRRTKDKARTHTHTHNEVPIDAKNVQNSATGQYFFSLCTQKNGLDAHAVGFPQILAFVIRNTQEMDCLMVKLAEPTKEKGADVISQISH